ncbi:unnamed protein product, partial [marine sediment metagenome]
VFGNCNVIFSTSDIPDARATPGRLHCMFVQVQVAGAEAVIEAPAKA